MITIYRSTARGLAVVEEPGPNCWVHAVEPDKREVAYVRDAFDIPEAFIAAALDPDEMARSDKEDDVTLIILLIPHVYDDPTDVPYSTVPLAIMLAPEQTVTMCTSETGFVQEFVDRQARARPVSTAKRNRLVLHLFLHGAQRYLAYLRQIDAATDVTQRKLQTSQRNSELMELLRYQKALTYFRTGLESNWLMMKRLQRSGLFDAFPEDEEFLEDVLTENEQAMEMTKISSDILSQMMDAFASIISNNLNVVMKILAVATIILSIPTVVASLYGMNVALPGDHYEHAFSVILATALALSAVALIFFWRRDWL